MKKNNNEAVISHLLSFCDRDAERIANELFCAFGDVNSVVEAARASLPDKDLIGKAYNIREEDGMIICDVIIDVMKNKSKNFMGLIDNYTLKTIKNSQRLDVNNYEIVRFLVYDKDFKRKVDEKLHG